MDSQSVGLSTIGFLDFEQLCKGLDRYYSFNLMDTRVERSFSDTIEKLKKHLAETMTSIEIESERKIIEYKIGKSHARAKYKTLRGVKTFKPFDVMNVRTWKLAGGINGRWWNTYYRENYDGLVALCAFTSSEIPRGLKDPCSPEECALQVEGQMIRDHSGDKRCTNKRDNSTGDKSNPPAKAGVVYVAYKLEPPSPDENIGDIEEENPSFAQTDDFINTEVISDLSHSHQTISDEYITSTSQTFIDQQQSNSNSPCKHRQTISPARQNEKKLRFSPGQLINTSLSEQSEIALHSLSSSIYTQQREPIPEHRTDFMASYRPKQMTTPDKERIFSARKTERISPGPSNIDQNSAFDSTMTHYLSTPLGLEYTSTKSSGGNSSEEPKRKVRRLEKKQSALLNKSENLTQILKSGCMPWCPPARREWGNKSYSLPGGIKWPPEGWRDFENDRKLLVLEYTIIELESLKKNCPSSLNSRMNLLNKYNFLVLPGTEMPCGTANHNVSLAYNYEILRKMELGQTDGVDLMFMNIMKAATKNRDNSTDYILDTISEVPLRLQDSLLQQTKQ